MNLIHTSECGSDADSVHCQRARFSGVLAFVSCVGVAQRPHRAALASRLARYSLVPASVTSAMTSHRRAYVCVSFNGHLQAHLATDYFQNCVNTYSVHSVDNPTLTFFFDNQVGFRSGMCTYRYACITCSKLNVSTEGKKIRPGRAPSRQKRSHPKHEKTTPGPKGHSYA